MVPFGLTQGPVSLLCYRRCDVTTSVGISPPTVPPSFLEARPPPKPPPPTSTFTEAFPTADLTSPRPAPKPPWLLHGLVLLVFWSRFTACDIMFVCVLRLVCVFDYVWFVSVMFWSVVLWLLVASLMVAVKVFAEMSIQLWLFWADLLHLESIGAASIFSVLSISQMDSIHVKKWAYFETNYSRNVLAKVKEMILNRMRLKTAGSLAFVHVWRKLDLLLGLSCWTDYALVFSDVMLLLSYAKLWKGNTPSQAYVCNHLNL